MQTFIMKKVSADTWLQFLGMSSVVAGLVFVGLEMQQTQRIALATATSDRMYQIVLDIYTTGEIGLDWSNIVFGDASELTEAERTQKRNNASVGWFITENDFNLYNLDLISEEVWEAKRGIISFYYNQCELRDIYEMRRPLMPIEFIQVVDSEIAKSPIVDCE
mgnify:FL=1